MERFAFGIQRLAFLFSAPIKRVRGFLVSDDCCLPLLRYTSQPMGAVVWQFHPELVRLG